MGYHKEATADEVWIGNSDRADERIAELKTAGIRSARRGKVAYCIEGKPLPALYAPLMISKADESAYDNFAMTEAFGPYWRRG
jgi:hypothetical protein